jgi:hypothetical protein
VPIPQTGDLIAGTTRGVQLHVIIDIDGTVANNKHRAHYVEGKQKDWDTFLRPDLVLKDTLIPGCARAIEKFQELKYEVVFVTGRHDPLRDATSRWLHEVLGYDATDSNLIMRSPGNMLNASEYKREQVMALKRERFVTGRGFLFLDDDPKALMMYAEYGIALKAPECWDLLFPVVKDESEY